jgi:MoxR-like ATPase
MEHIAAVNAALAARRALLVRGEPGTGKSQLAAAAARALGRTFIPAVIDGSTEPRDLLWRFDAVARLAEAQLISALPKADDAVPEPAEDTVRVRLAEQRFVAPGPIWWAFDWDSARTQAETVGHEPLEQWSGADPGNGAVLLIDEIDKADPSVPNALLEALGSGRLRPPGSGAPVRMKEPRPLVVITTNEERALPDAFLRRCVVLHLRLPKEDELVDFLVSRGAEHFPECSEEVLRVAAELLKKDRADVAHRGLCPPGQAEYLDLVRAVVEQASTEKQQLGLLDELARFTYRKHPEDHEQ